MDFAALLGGLGLFLLGVKGLSEGLTALAGPRLRRAVRHATGNPWRAAAAGLALGAATQSSNAVAFIAASLRSAGLMEPRRALPLVGWANVGTAGLVLLATLDLRAAALWLLAAAGFARGFLQGGAAWVRPALGAAASLGLLLLGLGLVKAGAAPLRDAAIVRELLAFAGEARLPLMLAGFALALVAQSSSTVSILAITLHGAGLLTFGGAAMAVCGASAGSGIATWLLAGGLTGTARQPIVFQAWLKGLGAAALAAAILAEEAWGWPGPLALVALGSREADTRLALLFLLLQAAPALLAAPLHRPLERALDRFVPATAQEALGRPEYLYPAALEDAPSALGLVAAEEARLLARLPPALDALREDAPPHDPAPLRAAPALEAEILAFLDALLDRPIGAAALHEAVSARARLLLLRDLREAVSGFAEAGAALPAEAAPMAEALHLLLEELRDAADAPARATLAALTEDRGEMMQRLRRRAAASDREAMLRLTSLFERTVWLIRRLALLEE